MTTLHSILNNNNSDPYINRVIFSKYLVLKKIGKGSFGTVYSGMITINQEKIAIKMEKKEKNSQGTLEIEAYRLIYLQGEGIPKIFCYGNNQTHNILIQELLGRSLEDLFNSCNKKFSLKTVCVLGIEIIKLIKYVHSKHHIHRDIKPDNIMTGREENENKIYIIDFGLAKKYYSISKNSHIKFCTGKSLTGTARYCSRNAHRGYEQSRRDDLESIGYVLMYFLIGSLPWQGLKIKQGEEQFQKIAEKKYFTSFEELCKGQPNEFLLYFKHVDSLEFEDEPNYDFLIGLFQEMINKYCNKCYYDFDWKKNVMTHLSENQHIYKKDISLLVNKNNGQSTLNESKNGTKLDVDFEGENIKKDNYYIKENLNFEGSNFNNNINTTNNNSNNNFFNNMSFQNNNMNMNNISNNNISNNFNNGERKKKNKKYFIRSSSEINFNRITSKKSIKINNNNTEIYKLAEKNNNNNTSNNLIHSNDYSNKKILKSKRNLRKLSTNNDFFYDEDNINNNKENNNNNNNINKKIDFNDINIEINNNNGGNNKHNSNNNFNNSNNNNVNNYNSNKDNNNSNNNNKKKKHRKHNSMEYKNHCNDDDAKCQCKIF